MNKLQEKLKEKLVEGVKFRHMSKAVGVDHVSIGKYYKGSIPGAMNLAKLEKYFDCEFEELRSESEKKQSGKLSPEVAALLDDDFENLPIDQQVEKMKQIIVNLVSGNAA